MKICPRCQKTYTDDNLNFCLEDGTTLQQMAGVPPPPTVQMSQPPVTSPTQAATSQPAWNTPQQYGGQPAKKSSKTWIWVLLILGAVVLLCGGGVVLLAFLGYQSDQGKANNPINTTNANIKTVTFGNTATKTNANAPVNGTSSRTQVNTIDLQRFHTADFSLYGETEMNGDELLLRSKQKNSYFVLVGKDKYAGEEYSSDHADTRVTLRNTDSANSRFGYGLIFHSNPDPLQQDYAFLIDTVKKKYRIAHHSANKEEDVTKWTSSTAINSGSAENILEVRDQGGTIDLYINGAKINTIKNEYGYADGVVGLYVGDGIQVAFKDLEVRR